MIFTILPLLTCHPTSKKDFLLKEMIVSYLWNLTKILGDIKVSGSNNETLIPILDNQNGGKFDQIFEIICDTIL